MVGVGSHHSIDEVDLLEEDLHGVFELRRTAIVRCPELRGHEIVKFLR